MDTHNLVNMANRIGQFFESYADRNEALEGIASHIRKFWDPRMRQLVLQQLDAPADSGLLPIVADALRAHRELLMPQAAVHTPG
jgi:formate dehydrogenase subunit delta